MAKGRVILVGAGPGDPDLITLKGLNALKTADTVVYDRLASPELLAHAPHGAELVDVGKSPKSHTMDQDQINQVLIDRALAGRTVVRLKGGDPFVFGRGGEEVIALAAVGIDYEIIPGITSGIAAPAYAGIPVTHRGKASCVTLITGHEDPTKQQSDLDWQSLAHTGGTLVFYMGVAQLPRITSELLAAGMSGDTPAACIQRGTTPRQRTVRGTLTDITQKAADAEITPPAIIVIGHVAAIGSDPGWFESRPLFGKRIVLTRPPEQSNLIAAQLAVLGAEIVFLPTIEIAQVEDRSDVDREISDLDSYDWIIFTSANAVWSFMGSLEELNLDARALGTIKVAVVGPATARALAGHRIKPDLIPEAFLAEGLLSAFRKRDDVAGERFLIPQSSIATSELADGLAELGADVHTVTVYVTRTSTTPDAAVVDRIRNAEWDVVTFTSSSTVHGFLEIIGAEPTARLAEGSARFASIGPVTSATAAQLGIPITIEPEKHTSDGLVQAILDNAPLFGLQSPASRRPSPPGRG